MLLGISVVNTVNTPQIFQSIFPIHGQFSCFQIGIIMNKTAMNIREFIILGTFSFLFIKYLGVELPNHRIDKNVEFH